MVGVVADFIANSSKMKINNIKVYDLEESLAASGYPMRTTLEEKELSEKDFARGLNLVNASYGNPAHAQWLTGVVVNFDLTCSNKMWVEAERYRFLSFVSSQSTMHRISKFNIKEQCNEYVDEQIIKRIEELRVKYLEEPTSENYLKLLYNIPSGFELTARLTTNYRSLLNIYIQRYNHRLPEWREFCETLLVELPFFKEIVAAYWRSKEKNETTKSD